MLGLMPLAAVGASVRPNILWIVTDDQRSDSLACYNRATSGRSSSPLGYVESPRIDALAAEGVLFTRAFCNSMACAPSRASMITGKYPHRSGIYGFEKTHLSAGCASRLVPEVLKEHGYQPASFGKSGVRIFPWEKMNQWQPPGFYDPMIRPKDLEPTQHSDYWFNRPWGRHNGKGMVLGTQEVYRFPGGETKQFWHSNVDKNLVRADTDTRAAVEEELDILRSYTRRNPNLIIGGVSPNTTRGTLDGAIVRCAEQYFASAGKSYTSIAGDDCRGPDPSRPIFTYVGFHFPHTPVLPSKEFRDRFAGKRYKVPAFDSRDAETLPSSMQKLRDDMDFSRMADAEKQQAIRDYYAFCAMGDELIGQTVDAFRAYCDRQSQPYVIVYVCGDHGWHLGEQGIEAKFTPWRQTVQDSMVVVSSDKRRFPPGTVCREMVEFVDLAPTFYDLAGVPKTEHPGLDGVSLLKTLDEGRQRDYIIGEMNQVRGDWAHLRSDDFTVAMRVRPFYTKPGNGYMPGERIRWGLTAPAEQVDLLLHDRRVDPEERINVAAKEEYRPLAGFLRQKLARIVLGDGRIECDWTKQEDFVRSDFAAGSHDRRLDFPPGLVPPPRPLN
ncbi:MAG: sulfatase-like hydrolase/transferase [Planctomycetota bacterium]